MKEALHPMRKKYHKNFYALNKVSLEVKKGEVLGIVGKNGSGKSTLLKIIAEVLQPTSGWVQANGKISALLELGAGFSPEFTGVENLYFYGSIMGYSRNEMDSKRAEIISFADIGEFINQPLKSYSSGMKSRLAFAAAINIDPDILVVDEVLAVGDELFRRKCYAKMEKFMEEGKTILLVSHSIETLIQLCSRAIMIDNGELLMNGDPKSVVNQYQRYIFANPQKQLEIRKEIKDGIINSGLTINKNHKMNAQSQKEKRNLLQSRQFTEICSQKNTINSDSDTFRENFMPLSKIEYKSYDVEVFDYNITTQNGHKVNMLKMGDKYIFSYNVKFNMIAENVSFGMNIKNEKSIVIAGASSLKMGIILKNVTPGTTFRIEWQFKCSLLPNIYYTNIGVTSIVEQKRIFLNRIVDALVFKVLPIEHNGYFGFVTLEYNAQIKRI
jgi:lipopolysaccharide transport system ATP-binding protein